MIVVPTIIRTGILTFYIIPEITLNGMPTSGTPIADATPPRIFAPGLNTDLNPREKPDQKPDQLPPGRVKPPPLNGCLCP